MKSLLLRNGSLPKQGPAFPASQKFSLSRSNSISGIFSPGERINASGPPRISLNLEINRLKSTPIGRTQSETDIVRSETEISGGLNKLVKATSRSFPARIPEEEHVLVDENDRGSWNLHFPMEDLGLGKGMKSGGGNGNKKEFGGNDSEGRKKMGEYYEEIIKSNPGDALLLRNYGKFLEEVEGDGERAEEYYGRAILANPGDGEVLSLYGKLIWDFHRDGERAKSYFDQAVSASPDDCMVMGSYARFMWEAAEEDEEEEEESVLSPAMLAVL